ncbi:MAG: Holliday junction branch migration protein RuvA [Oscillospiraceae bacterium]|nr:Holliday junction branch migration protein RuvA [Oscillospiraceae bacterium]
MFYSVSGQVVHKGECLAVIECGGVGYACRTSASTLSDIKIGDDVKLLTHLYVREDAVELFGFSSAAELNAFRMLITVSGVGPKAGLSVLSCLSPQGFALCVASGDSKLLTKAQGIGAKIAQRIVLELKDKVDKQFGTATPTFANTMPNIGVSEGNKAQAVSALMVLGFNSGDAFNALTGFDDDIPTSELIKGALKRLS